MNYNKNVVVFTLVFTIILLGYSVLISIYPAYSFGLNNLSIVADVVKVKSIDSTVLQTPIDSINHHNNDVTADVPTGPRDIKKYLQPKTITSFSADNTIAALPQTMHKLSALKQSKKGKVRIAWLGDSFIEGDQLTKTFRNRMQQFFGGFGVGFVPITSVTVDGFRSTISQKWTGDWVEENFKNKELTKPLFLSGRLYYSGNGTLTIKDHTLDRDSTQRLEKSLICGAGNATITVNGQGRQYTASKRLNRIVLDSSTGHSLNLGVQNDKLPVYGISMEPKNGVVVDNFSFRGISGEELGKLDTGFIRAIQEQNPYDLVVLEYGVNVLYRPDNTDFAWHKRNMMKVLQKLRSAFPNTEFLIVSTSDRGFRYGEVAKSAVGIDNLVKAQAELAFDNGMAFFNMFASMGGAGTIVKWADSTPTLAGHDYVHPNGRGAEILGNLFFESFMKDYEKANNPNAAKPQPAVAPVAPVTQPTVTAATENPALKPTPSHYTKTSYGSIVDKRTGLEWMIAEDKDYTWDDARQWAANLKAGNATWSLPTINQIITLYDSTATAGQGFVYTDGKNYPAKINSAFNKIGHGSWIWSAQEVDSTKAYSVNLNQNRRIKSLKNKVSYPIRVFAVKRTEPPKTNP